MLSVASAAAVEGATSCAGETERLVKNGGTAPAHWQATDGLVTAGAFVAASAPARERPVEVSATAEDEAPPPAWLIGGRPARVVPQRLA